MFCEQSLTIATEGIASKVPSNEHAQVMHNYINHVYSSYHSLCIDTR